MDYFQSYSENNSSSEKYAKLSYFNQSGIRLKKIRENRGITQEELGEKTGYCQMSISKKESGARQISVCDLISFAKALNLSPQEVLYILGIVSE